MATSTLSPAQVKARRTTVAMKMLMATTGALFVFYVLMHMYGNLKIFGGQDAFDTYAHHLRTLGEPILPYEGFLWVFRLVLVASLVGHAYSAFYLWTRARSARPTGYAVRLAGAAAWRSQAMRWGGVALLLFLVFHLIQFTISKVNFNSGVAAAKIGDSPYQLVVASFQLWWVVLVYVLALLALGLHLEHGVWSGAQTLGWTGSPRARGAAKMAARLIAAVVVVGFALPPLSILFGIVK
ncbi:MAG TPA: succinate dehydrogenase cytochrome b subunit [Candidatus Lustribacter sp.]|nr:succinate dehydrogenase cytochrome b subunit [Candidatus Lustribacter sp.]